MNIDRGRVVRRVGLACAVVLLAGALTLLARGAAFGDPSGDRGFGASPGFDAWFEFWDNNSWLPPPLSNSEGGSHTIDTGVRIACFGVNDGPANTPLCQRA